MKILVPLAVVASLALASCSTAIPIAGQMERSPETFSGTFSGGGFRSGPGELTLVSNSRAICRANVVFTSRRRGEGVLNCDDGRTGPVHMSGYEGTGSGFGELAGQRFTFTFGKA